MTRTVLTALLMVILAAGVLVLRSQFMTRRAPVPPDSSTTVAFRVVIRGGPGDLPTVARALALPCVADVDAERSSPLRQVRPDRFRLVLRPALDSDSRRKLRGCLADLRVPHALARGVELTTRGVPED